ncbi:VTT domain-containing protein [Acidiphilium acidophilum]|uniref:TVP38/TMEM64 family protein n=1 Tax=Acidiphilium acidophilum TaxID=76588 RepID=UPI002E8E7364|nr:VTT domain-containing protein [Acidiphilium acidophilum]
MIGRDRRIVVAGLIACVLLLAAAASAMTGLGDGGVVLRRIEGLRALGVTGGLVFVALQMLTAVVGFLPASLLGIAAGAIYGVGLGFGLAAAGLMLGAAIAFGLARTGLRPAIGRLMARRTSLDRLDMAVGHEGWRFVLLLRISPIMPFSLTSYALGLSAVSARDYALGTFAALPALLAYVSLGAVGTGGLRAAGGTGSVHAVLILAGVAATLLLGLQVIRLMIGLRRPVSQP